MKRVCHVTSVVRYLYREGEGIRHECLKFNSFIVLREYLKLSAMTHVRVFKSIIWAVFAVAIHEYELRISMVDKITICFFYSRSLGIGIVVKFIIKYKIWRTIFKIYVSSNLVYEDFLLTPHLLYIFSFLFII